MRRTPILRPVSWSAAAINGLVLLAFMAVGWIIYPPMGVFVGMAVYLLCSHTLRAILAREHRAAIARCKRQEFEQAIPRFKNSLAYFNRHPWIDRFRAIAMLSCAGMSYREMAMVSLGFCYGQIGDGKASRKYYEMCLEEFPDSSMAEAALRLIDAARSAANQTS